MKNMKNLKNMTLLILLVFGLAACHGDGDTHVVETPTPTPTPDPNPTPDPVPTPDPNLLKSLAVLGVNDEAGVIANGIDLSDDINALFQGVEPVELETGESLSDVIDRAEGS